jgi:hypothetical protein
MNAKPLLLFATLLVIAACTEGSMGRKNMTTEPEPMSPLSQQERAALRRGVDADALERMLGGVPPEHRDEILAFFQSNGLHRGIVGAQDPGMNGMLREVWRPGGTAAGEPLAGATLDISGITIILSEHAGEASAGALVIRESRTTGESIVLDPRHANPLQLYRAVGVLMQSRFADGYPADREIRIPVEVVRTPDGSRAADEVRDVATRIYGPTIDRLVNAEPAELPQFGKVRAVSMETPPGKPGP